MASLLAAVAVLYAPVRLQCATAAATSATFGGHESEFRPFAYSVHRPVPSGGGTYPVELYAAVVGDDSLPSGVYHYDAVHHALERLATGDPRPGLRPGLRTEPGPCTILVTCRLWKNEPKYRAFGYRLGCADAGVMIGQLTAAGLPSCRVRFMFGDEPLGEFLGLEPELEAVYATVELAPPSTLDRLSTAAGPSMVDRPSAVPRRAANDGPAGPVDAPSLGMTLDRVRSAMANPAAIRLHRASICSEPAAGAAPPDPWGSDVQEHAVTRLATVPRLDLPEPVVAELSGGVAERRSAVRFGVGALSAVELATVLRHALTGYDSDVSGTDVHASCVIQRVDGIEAGVYRYDPAAHALVPLAGHGSVDEVLHSLRTDLGGGLLSTAACVYLSADLETGLRTVGDRWYRILSMKGGIATQRACLAAAVVGVGCRPSFAYHGASMRALLELPAGHVDLIQLLLGRPAVRAGMIEIDLAAVVGAEGGPR